MTADNQEGEAIVEHAAIPLQLARYDAARAALAEAYRVDEVKDIHDKAAALQEYARQAKDGQLIGYATDLRLRAGRRGGEIFRKMAESGERRPRGGDSESSCAKLPKLCDLGVTKPQSSRWQKLAALPESVFEAHVTETRKRLEHSLDKTGAHAPAAKAPRTKKAPRSKIVPTESSANVPDNVPLPVVAKAEPAESIADFLALQEENRQLRADLEQAQRRLDAWNNGVGDNDVLPTPAALIAMLDRIYNKARDRRFWPDDPRNWELVKGFADLLQNALSTARALEL